MTNVQKFKMNKLVKFIVYDLSTFHFFDLMNFMFYNGITLFILELVSSLVPLITMALFYQTFSEVYFYYLQLECDDQVIDTESEVSHTERGKL